MALGCAAAQRRRVLPKACWNVNLVDVDLAVDLGRLRLANPILVASGTFGYAREMAGLVDLHRLGGILPKDHHAESSPRQSAAADLRNQRRHAQFHRPG